MSEPEQNDKAATLTSKYTIVIEDSGETFQCAGDEVILKAMIALGRRGIPSGCHGGGCGVCKVKVLSGEFHTGPMSREHVSAQEQQQGVALACQVYPGSGLTVKVLGKMRRAVVAERRYGFV